MPQCKTCNRNASIFGVDVFTKECSECSNEKKKLKRKEQLAKQKDDLDKDKLIRPIYSIIGLLLLFVSVGGGILCMQDQARAGGFAGFGGFAIILLWMIAIPCLLYTSPSPRDRG